MIRLVNVSKSSPYLFFENGVNGNRTFHTFYTNHKNEIDFVRFVNIKSAIEPSDEIFVRIGNRNPFPPHQMKSKVFTWKEFKIRCLSKNLAINRMAYAIVVIELGIKINDLFMPLASESTFDFINSNARIRNYNSVEEFRFTAGYEAGVLEAV